MGIGLVHVAGGLVATTLVLLGAAVGTGRIDVRDVKGLLTFDLSPGSGPDSLAEDAKKRIQNLQAGSDQQLKKMIAREIDHALRTAYVEGKAEGRMNAENEDKHFKVSVIAMLAVIGLLLFELVQFFGMV